MRTLLVLFALVATPVAASEPGQPLDCSDWVFLEDGLSCLPMTECATDDPSPPNTWCYGRAFAGVAADNSGRFLRLRSSVLEQADCGGAGIFLYRRELVALNASGLEHVVAFIDDRCGAPLSADMVDLDNTPSAVAFDATGGSLLIPLKLRCTQNSIGHCAYSELLRTIRIDGFPALFDVLQSYASDASIGFRVPYMPEGMGGADRFDSYYGDIATVGDWSQAHGLQCNYPAAPPSVGDYLSIPDTLPTPAPGSGYYYVTSATYQGQTRFGRRTRSGQLSGRDPAVLPACTTE